MMDDLFKGNILPPRLLLPLSPSLPPLSPPLPPRPCQTTRCLCWSTVRRGGPGDLLLTGTLELCQSLKLSILVGFPKKKCLPAFWIKSNILMSTHMSAHMRKCEGIYEGSYKRSTNLSGHIRHYISS